MGLSVLKIENSHMVTWDTRLKKLNSYTGLSVLKIELVPGTFVENRTRTGISVFSNYNSYLGLSVLKIELVRVSLYFKNVM